MRVDLGGGHWAELKERLTWAERNRIRDAAQGEEGFFGGFATMLVKTYTTAWDVPGGLALGDEGWATLDGDSGDAIFKAALDLWKATPKADGGTSSST